MTKVTQQKEKDFEDIVERVDFTDMPEDKRIAVVEFCKNAYKLQHDGELKYYKDLALHIKHEMETKFNGSWHVAVGTHFGSYITSESKTTI